MGADFLMLVVALAAFVGTHFLMSHPWRKPMVRSLGEKPFQAVYSLVSIVTLGFAIVAFKRNDPAPMLWNGEAVVPWTLASGLTYVATALFLASLTGNPALPGARIAGLSAILPKGVYRITRHPMMWAFALISVAHILVAPTPRTIALSVAVIVLALGGSHLQDRKKDKLHGRDWRSWLKRTTFWPDVRQAGKLGYYWVIALLPWLLVTAAHLVTAHEYAGIWKPIHEMRHPDGGLRRSFDVTRLSPPSKLR